MTHGGQCAMMSGALLTRPWCASSWVMVARRRSSVVGIQLQPAPMLACSDLSFSVSVHAIKELLT